MKGNEPVHQTTRKILYFVLPIVFPAVIYGLASFYFMTFDAHDWTHKARMLVGCEGFLLSGAGWYAASQINDNN